MGMAASQARYLGLTARKTNVEYEGQQVNQARTALANQSANTFNELLALEVPTAPSTQDFTTTQYSYEDGSMNEVISSMVPIEGSADDYNFLVTHYHFADVYTGIQNEKRNPQVFVGDRVDKKEISENPVQTSKDASGKTIYSVDGKECSVYNEADAAQKTAYDRLSASFSDLKEIDPANLLTYKDAGGNIHFVVDSEIEKVVDGTDKASDFSIKNGKATKNSIDSNKIVNTAEGAYTVNGYECFKYDETDEKIKAAYELAVSENASLGKVDKDKLYTYEDEEDGIHFISQADIDGVLAGSGSANDYEVLNDVPYMIGNIVLSMYDPSDTEQLSAYNQIVKDWENTTFANSKSRIYTWVSNQQRYFACEEDLMNSWNSAPDPAQPSENQQSLMYYCAKNVSTKIENTERAVVDLDESGRAETIRYEDSSLVRVLSTETVTDEAAYNDAMNQYNYAQTVYEKKLADINAKTKKIQEQDRTLELRLRQLDTEQEALQTEMEAVKKVIEKNIESTFKTFE